MSVDKFPQPMSKESYRDTLDIDIKAKYDQKINIIGGMDPYELTVSEWSYNVRDIPEIMYPDVYEFLVDTQKAYSKDEMRGYKSLDGYKYFVGRCLKDIGVVKMDNSDLSLVTAWVRSLSHGTPFHPWLIAENSGKVVTAHCKCKDGLGGSCSHVIALLLTIDHFVRHREDQALRQEEEANWLSSEDQDEGGMTIAEIFSESSPKTKKKKLDRNSPPNVPEPTSERIEAFFAALHASGSNAAVLSVIPEYSKYYIPKEVEKKYPLVLSDLLDEEFVHVDKELLMNHCEKLMKEITVNAEEVNNVEDVHVTCEQKTGQEWQRWQTGRITPKQMLDVCETSIDNPSQDLVKSICYPDEKSTKATKVRCQHKKDVLHIYVQQSRNEHENFFVRESGFVICENYPFIGASPDFIASCDCCGEVCVEIKCAYCQGDSLISDSADSNFCLEKHGDNIYGQLRLKKSHQYYYEVQCQLLVCEQECTDFIVWTNDDYHAERIELDPEMYEEMVKKSSAFFKRAILPELVGKLYSRPLTATPSDVNSSIKPPADISSSPIPRCTAHTV